METLPETPRLWEWLKARLARALPGLFPRDWQWSEAAWQRWEALLQAAEVAERPRTLTETQPSPSPAAEQGPVPPSWPRFDANRLPTAPLAALAAMVLALGGQMALNPPRRLVPLGLTLYLLALVLWLLVLRHLEPIQSNGAQSGADSEITFRPTALALATATGIAAFALFHGNRLTPHNLALWLATMGGVFVAFWPGAARNPGGRGPRFPLILRLDALRMAFLGALLVAIFFRGFRLAQVPPEMFSDHAEKLYDVMDVLDGQWRIFFPRNTGREGFQMYLTALMARVFGTGISFMSLKLGTFFMGLFMLPYVYLLGREVVGPWAGVAAMLLTGMAYWPNVQARVALRFILYPAFVAPTFYHLLRALRRGSPKDFLWAGFFLGLGLHGYSPFRIVPLTVLLAAALAFFWPRRTIPRTRILQGMVILVITAFAVFLPLFRYMLDAPHMFFYRAATRVGQMERPYPDNPVRIFIQESWQALIMPWWDDGTTWVHSVVGHPALSVVDGPLFALGLTVALGVTLRQRRWEPLFLILSVYVLMLPSILSLAFPIENPSLNRTAGAVVPIFLLAGWGLVTWAKALSLSSRRKGAQYAAGLALAFLLGLDALHNSHLVFHQYARTFRLSAWNTTELGQVIGGFARSVGGPDQAWVIPYPHWVDTRLVGINAGFPRKDYALPREKLGETLHVPGPKLFLFKPEDGETEQALWQLYPQGRLWRYISPTPGKDFMVFFVP